jgi:hypothetical protein
VQQTLVQSEHFPNKISPLMILYRDIKNYLGQRWSWIFKYLSNPLCQSFFECQNLSNSFIFYFFSHCAVMPKDFYACLTNCVGVFRETGSVTHKKVAGRPFVRTEEIVTRNKLR